jgi:hypothetical protein
MARHACVAAAAVLPPARREAGVRGRIRASVWNPVRVQGHVAIAGHRERSRVLPTAAQAASPSLRRVMIMLDFLMIAGGVGFFVVAILYVIACEKM